jgi:SAM-dependent methyltransferase
MAPELALEALDRTKRGSLVLDPMCGSGTVLKHAIANGHHAVGFDLDPLAIMISRVSCRHLNASHVMTRAMALLERVSQEDEVHLPWIDLDPETDNFTRYWFAATQRKSLRKLAYGLHGTRGPTADLLRVALSRTIITKDRGASLARDVSHSRPHRVRDWNDYDVFDGFLDAAARIAAIVDQVRHRSATVLCADARSLPRRFDAKADLIITSPPYLNAIDYMRAHRMSLVWFGYRISELRDIRATTVGAERKAVSPSGSRLVAYDGLTNRQKGMLDRYAADMHKFCSEIRGKLRPQAEAVVVVGDCMIRGVFVRNSEIVAEAAQQSGLRLVDSRRRALPNSSRYLPPPSARESSALANRLRDEVVLRFRHDPAVGP